ncbi:MAG: hypothetical protein ACR2H1_08615 [Limisphaerales bacterium]
MPKKVLFILMATFPFYTILLYDRFFDWMYYRLSEVLRPYL